MIIIRQIFQMRILSYTLKEHKYIKIPYLKKLQTPPTFYIQQANSETVVPCVATNVT